MKFWSWIIRLWLVYDMKRMAFWGQIPIVETERGHYETWRQFCSYQHYWIQLDDVCCWLLSRNAYCVPEKVDRVVQVVNMVWFHHNSGISMLIDDAKFESVSMYKIEFDWPCTLRFFRSIKSMVNMWWIIVFVVHTIRVHVGMDRVI